jgi:putative ABC transport system substrate-binding protein
MLAIALVLCLFAAPLEAQPSHKIYRIGFLRPGQPPKYMVEPFEQGLHERGYVVGQNVIIDYRFADGASDQLPRLAEELLRLKVDLILASGGPPALVAQKLTTQVPIVFVGVVAPEQVGLVQGLARPGGNITGLSLNSADLLGKRLELLKELVPRATRVAVVWNPTNPVNRYQLKEVEVAARTLDISVQPVAVRGPDRFASAFEALRGVDGLFVVDDPLFTTHLARLTQIAARKRIPAIYGGRNYAEAGGLMSYGAYLPDVYRRAAGYVDKILRGAKPADLPVEQPTKFELVINLKTAMALGLTIPPTLRLRADEVIE